MPCIRSYMEESGERLDEEDDGMCGGRGIGVGDPESVEFFCHNTGLPAYSDSGRTMKKCPCNRVSLYPMIFSIRIILFWT